MVAASVAVEEPVATRQSGLRRCAEDAAIAAVAVVAMLQNYSTKVNVEEVVAGVVAVVVVVEAYPVATGRSSNENADVGIAVAVALAVATVTNLDWKKSQHADVVVVVDVAAGEQQSLKELEWVPRLASLKYQTNLLQRIPHPQQLPMSHHHHHHHLEECSTGNAKLTSLSTTTTMIPTQSLMILPVLTCINRVAEAWWVTFSSHEWSALAQVRHRYLAACLDPSAESS